MKSSYYQCFGLMLGFLGLHSLKEWIVPYALFLTLTFFTIIVTDILTEHNKRNFFRNFALIFAIFDVPAMASYGIIAPLPHPLYVALQFQAVVLTLILLNVLLFSVVFNVLITSSAKTKKRIFGFILVLLLLVMDFYFLLTAKEWLFN